MYVRAIRRSPALAVALAVLLLGGVGLSIVHHGRRAAISRRAAIHYVFRDPRGARAVQGAYWDRVEVSPVDDRLQRVSFYAGARIVGEVALRSDGSVEQAVQFTQLKVPYGNWLAYEPAVLAALSLLFVLVAGVAPLARLRNLDVLAALSLLASMLLLQRRYLDASVLSAAPGLGYLTVRCASFGLGPRRTARPATPLLDSLTASWTLRERNRLLRSLLSAVVLVFVMVGISSPDAVDVVYAVMEGATKLLHGVLPYGHMPGDVIHGDTYPLLSYALYMPLAAAAPVASIWDAVDLALGFTVLAAVLVAALLLGSVGTPGGRTHWRASDSAAETAGLRAALTWLAFPPLLVTVSTGTTDVVLAAMLLGAVALWRRPGASTALLSAAAWFKLAPAALVPIWLAPLRGRRLLGALAGALVVSVAMLALLVAVGGTGGPGAMLHALGYQLSRGSPQSLWAATGLGQVQPLAQACVLALIAGAAIKLALDPVLSADRQRIAAISAAILIALQLVGDYWAFLYVVWVVPLLAISVLYGEQALSGAKLPAERRARIPDPALGTA